MKDDNLRVFRSTSGGNAEGKEIVAASKIVVDPTAEGPHLIGHHETFTGVLQYCRTELMSHERVCLLQGSVNYLVGTDKTPNDIDCMVIATSREALGATKLSLPAVDRQDRVVNIEVDKVPNSLAKDLMLSHAFAKGVYKIRKDSLQVDWITSVKDQCAKKGVYDKYGRLPLLKGFIITAVAMHAYPSREEVDVYAQLANLMSIAFFADASREPELTFYDANFDPGHMDQYVIALKDSTGETLITKHPETLATRRGISYRLRDARPQPPQELSLIAYGPGPDAAAKTIASVITTLNHLHSRDAVLPQAHTTETGVKQINLLVYNSEPLQASHPEKPGSMPGFSWSGELSGQLTRARPNPPSLRDSIFWGYQEVEFDRVIQMYNGGELEVPEIEDVRVDDMAVEFGKIVDDAGDLNAMKLVATPEALAFHSLQSLAIKRGEKTVLFRNVNDIVIRNHIKNWFGVSADTLTDSIRKVHLFMCKKMGAFSGTSETDRSPWSVCHLPDEDGKMLWTCCLQIDDPVTLRNIFENVITSDFRVSHEVLRSAWEKWQQKAPKSVEASSSSYAHSELSAPSTPPRGRARSEPPPHAHKSVPWSVVLPPPNEKSFASRIG